MSRSMATGSVIELSNYLEQKIAQKSSEYAAVCWFKFQDFLIAYLFIQ